MQSDGPLWGRSENKGTDDSAEPLPNGYLSLVPLGSEMLKGQINRNYQAYARIAEFVKRAEATGRFEFAIDDLSTFAVRQELAAPQNLRGAGRACPALRAEGAWRHTTTN